MLRKLLLTAGAVVLSAGMAMAEMPKQINFGIISTESSTALEAGFSPFMKDSPGSVTNRRSRRSIGPRAKCSPRLSRMTVRKGTIRC